MTAKFDNTRAYKEGWGLFYDPGDDRCHIQKLDDPGSVNLDHTEHTFANDREAFQHVVDNACAGSTYHRRALDFIPWAPDA